MRRCGFLLSLILAVGQAIAADPSKAEKPWDPALIERLPEVYRAAVWQSHLTYQVRQEQLLYRQKERGNDEAIFRVAVSLLAVKPEGEQFLLGRLKTEDSVDLRAWIVKALFGKYRSDALLKKSGNGSEGMKLVDELLVSDPSVKVALTAVDEMMAMERNRMAHLIKDRLALAKQHDDAEGEDLLLRRSNDFNYATTLPEFAYQAPAVFQAAAADTRSIRVLAFGDFGTGGPNQIKTAEAMRTYHQKSPFNFGVTLGDNFYQDGLPDPQSPRWRTQWEDLYGPMGVKFYATLGNHDYAQPDSPAAQIAYGNRSSSWRMPAPFYTYTAGPAQFFALDTVRLERKQLNWLAQALTQSTAKWKIVYGHYHIFSANRGDHDRTDRQDLVSRLLPVLKQGKADIYLCGHEHHMQELKPEDGVHFFVAGSGGAGLYEFEKENDYPRSAFRSKTHGFAVLDVTSEKATMSFIGLDGKALHRREIVKTN